MRIQTSRQKYRISSELSSSGFQSTCGIGPPVGPRQPPDLFGRRSTPKLQITMSPLSGLMQIADTLLVRFAVWTARRSLEEIALLLTRSCMPSRSTGPPLEFRRNAHLTVRRAILSLKANTLNRFEQKASKAVMSPGVPVIVKPIGVRLFRFLFRSCHFVIGTHLHHVVPSNLLHETLKICLTPVRGHTA